MSDMLYKATKYMNAEDVLLAREEKPRKRKRQEDIRQDRGERWLERENNGKTDASSPPLGSSQVSPPWLPRSIKS